LDTTGILCIIARRIKNKMRKKGFMLMSKKGRSALFLIFSAFLFACLSSSGSNGYAATEAAGRSVKTTAIELPTSLAVELPTAMAGQTASESDGPFVAQMPVVVSTTPIQTNCRYGIGNEPGEEANNWLNVVGAGHYINFIDRTLGPPVPESVEFLRQVRISQDKEDGEYLPSFTVSPPLHMEGGGLGVRLQANPGTLWIVGNEPDVGNAAQDDTYPEWYARAYHDVYHFIKEVDPTAQVAIAGLSMMTPGRLQYLEIVWDTYLQEYGEPIPVDVWNMHLYILSEIRPWDNGPSDGKIALGTDPSLAIKAPEGPPETECPRDDVYCRAEHDDINIFMDQVLAMRSWMKDHGQQDKPLLISEFSQLYPFVDYDDPVNPNQCFLMDEFGQCFTQDRVSTFLQQTMDFLESAEDPDLGYPADGNRLVQQWAWYSLWVEGEHSGGSSNLLVDGYESMEPGSLEALTKIGQMYRERALTSPLTVNLVAAEAPDVEEEVGEGEETADVELQVGFYNNGSGYILNSFTVTFYADAELTQVIGETVVSPAVSGIINGCSWDHITDWAAIPWTDVPVGNHEFWVKVDSNDIISSEIDEADNVLSGQVTITNTP
jgi:hypothetical protein